MSIKNPFTQRFWTRKKVISVFAVIGVVSLLVLYYIPLGLYGGTFLSQVEYGSTGGSYTLQEQNEPSVYYRANFTFTAVGAIAFGNNIHFVAYVYDVNITDFTSHYIGVIFADAYTPSTGPVNTAANHAYFALFEPAGNGVWKAEGDMAFFHPLTFTGPILIPQWTSTVEVFNPGQFEVPVMAQVKAYDFNLPLQSQDVTNNLISQMTTIRYEAMLALIAALVVIAVPVVMKAGRQG